MNLLMQAENCGVEYFSSCEFQMSYIIAIFNFNGNTERKVYTIRESCYSVYFINFFFFHKDLIKYFKSPSLFEHLKEKSAEAFLFIYLILEDNRFLTE